MAGGGRPVRASACAAIAALLLGLAPAASAQTNTQPTAVIVAGGSDYDVSPAAATGAGVQASIVSNEQQTRSEQQMRSQYVEQAATGFARSMGWDLVDTIRGRARATDTVRRPVDMSGLVKYAQSRVGSDVDVEALVALARAEPGTKINVERLVSKYLRSKANAERAVAFHDAAVAAQGGEGIPQDRRLSGDTGWVDVRVWASEHTKGRVFMGPASGGSASGDETDSQWRRTTTGQREGAAARSERFTDQYTDTATLGKGQPANSGADQAADAATPADPPSDYVTSRNAADVSAWEDVQVWTNFKSSDMAFAEESGPSFEGEMTSIAIGVERLVGDRGMLGVAVNWFSGEIDHSYTTANITGTGKTEMTQWILAPYAALSMESARIWGAIGLGGGTLDYEDQRAAKPDSSDVEINMAAVGVEYDLFRFSLLDLVARAEAMSTGISIGRGDDRLYDGLSARVHGARGEVELGLPMVFEDGHIRPYLTGGYRWDGGDGVTGGALEYGGGLTVNWGMLTLEGAGRTQELDKDEDYERDNYSVSLGFGHRSGRGLRLNLRNTYGSVQGEDYFAQNMAWDQLSSGGVSPRRARTGFEAAYGFPVKGLLTGRRAGLLTPFVKTDLQGDDIGLWSLGLGLESEFGGIDLVHTTRSAIGGADDHEIQLKLNFDY